MRQRIRVVYWAVLALRREYSIMGLAVSNNYETGARPDLSRKPGPRPAHHLTGRR